MFTCEKCSARLAELNSGMKTEKKKSPPNGTRMKDIFDEKKSEKNGIRMKDIFEETKDPPKNIRILIKIEGTAQKEEALRPC